MSATPQTLFLPYQRRWIEDDSRLKIMEKSRQIGMTWAAAYRAVRTRNIATSPADLWVSSRDALQARLFVEDCLRFARYLSLAAALHGCGELVDDVQAQTISFANGGRIHALSSHADAQAGKRGGRLLDEFALHPDPRRLYAIAYPGITWGGSLEIVSTHRGHGNFFAELIREITEKGNPKGFSHHRVTLVDALDQGFLERLQSRLPNDDPRQAMTRDDYFDFVRRGCPDEESFREEFLCEPARDTAIFLPWDDVMACSYAPGAMDAMPTDLNRCNGPCYLGIDLGRDHDLTVFWLLENIEDVFYTRRVVALRETPFHEQEETLASFMTLPNLRRVAIDQTGLGRQFAERAERRYGASRVERMHLSHTVKEALAYPLRTAFEQRLLRVPDDPAIRRDLRRVRREYTAAGHLRFVAERDAAGHSDHFWALALALYAGASPAVPFAWEPVTRNRSARL